MSVHSSTGKTPDPQHDAATNASQASSVESRVALVAPKKVELDKDLTDAWLSWQCEMVSGVICGAIFSPELIRPTTPVSVWPKQDLGIAQLVAAATQARKKNTGVKFSKIAYGPNQQRLCDVIACPIYKDGSMIAIIAMSFSIRSEPQQLAVMQLLRWGGLWFETLLDKQQPDARHQQELALQIITSVENQASTLAACIEAVNMLAQTFACERVSIGLKDGLSIKLQAISQTPSFEANSPLARHLEANLSEACEQKRTLCYPNILGKNQQYTAHANLRQHHGSTALLTVPLLRADEVLGAICFEQQSSALFDVTTARQCESIAQLIRPVLEHQIEQEQPLSTHVRSASKRWLGSIFGPRQLKARLILAAACFFLAATANIDVTHKVSAPASIKGAVQQIIVAPQAGYVKDSTLRAGDEVNEGQLMATLEDRTLQLELQKFEGQKSQITQQYHAALAQQDRIEIGKLRAELDQIDADIAITEQALSRTSIKAPFDGVVISGDLSQSLGTPIELGQELFEIAPLENYRVLLETPERDIGKIAEGQSGYLVISAFPDRTFNFQVSQIVPLAASNASGNYFQVEATLNEPSELLRPGMSGHGKIESGERSLLWISTHRLTENIRIFAWSLGL